MNRAICCAVACGLLLGIDLACCGRSAGQEKAAAASPAEAVQAYRDAANLQNNGALDVAAEEWQKFLQAFPKDPLAAKAQHYLGVCQHELKRTEAAIASFEAVLKSHPQFELREDALYRLGLCQYALATSGKAEMYGGAATTFGKLLTAFPKGKYVEDALYYQGESLYAAGQKDPALAAHERLVREFSKSKRRADALYALGTGQEESGKFADAGRTYDLFLKEFAEHASANEVRARKAETLLQTGDVAAAAKLFGEVAAVKGFAAADHALYQQAYCMAKLDKLAEAATVYAKLAAEFEKSSYVADATIAAGRLYYKTDNRGEAKRWLEKAVAAGNSDSPEAAHWLCKLLIKAGQPAEAAALAEKQRQASADSRFAAELQFDQADALYEIPERRPESLALYGKFAADRPRHELAPQALYNAAFAAQELKQYDDALRHATDFLASYPQDRLVPDVKYVAAECNLLLKKYDEAEKLYRELVEKHADHSSSDAWRVRLGLVAYQQGKYDAALATLAPLADSLKSADTRAEAWYLLGASHFHLDQFADATAALTKSLAANPKWRQADDALLLLARAQAKVGKSAEAQASLQRMQTEFPSSRVADEAHYRLAQVLDEAGDWKAAAGEYDVVATKFGDSAFAPYALYGKGTMQHRAEQFVPAIESFTSLVSKYSDHKLKADALLARAVCRRQSRDPRGALTDLDSFLQSNPTSPRRSEAQHERGICQVALRDFAGAVATLQGLLQTDANYAAADKLLYEIGWALKSQEKHADATAYFVKIVAEHPSSAHAAEAHFHVGEDHYNHQRYAEAAKEYAAAIGSSPGGSLGENGLHKLGWSQFQLKNYKDALAQFNQQLATFPQGPVAADGLFMKAECLFRQEDFKNAWPAYQAALKTKASSPLIETLTLLHGGQAAAQLKQWDESIQLLSQISSKQPETPLLPEALYELGWSKQNLGQTDEAAGHYEAAATKSRDHVGARARFMLGELLFTQKKHPEAIREFQRAMFGYGGDQAPAETKNWQAQSGYEAGRCAEVQIATAADAAAKQKNLADAKRLYTFVVEKHPSHELAAEAKKRLETLSRL